MNLPLFTLRKKTIVVTAVVLLFVFGLFALKTNSRREDPEFTIATCTINCDWPGATAEDVENLVTDALEEAVDTMDEVDEITSTSYSGFGPSAEAVAARGSAPSSVASETHRG